MIKYYAVLARAEISPLIARYSVVYRLIAVG
jgi:hypothetical protein